MSEISHANEIAALQAQIAATKKRIAADEEAKAKNESPAPQGLTVGRLVRKWGR